MILTMIILAVSIFSAENLVPVIIGGLTTLGVTQVLKNQTGLYRFGAAILAFVISVLVAVAAFIVSTFLSGGEITFQTIAAGATQIFTLATLAYHALPKAEE